MLTDAELLQVSSSDDSLALSLLTEDELARSVELAKRTLKAASPAAAWEKVSELRSGKPDIKAAAASDILNRTGVGAAKGPGELLDTLPAAVVVTALQLLGRALQIPPQEPPLRDVTPAFQAGPSVAFTPNLTPPGSQEAP